MLSVSRTVVRAVVLALVTAMLALGFSASATAAPRLAAASPGQKADPPPTIRGINVLDDYSATISGLVYNENGHLLDNIQVDAFSAEDPTGDVVASDLTYEYQDAAAHGAFQLHVPAGSYLIRFSSPDWAEQHVYETVYYGGGAGDPVTVAADDAVTLEDTTLVADTGAPVTGTVLDASNAPLPGVEVNLVRMFGDGDYVGVAYAVTDATGSYTFPHVKHHGQYSVLAYGGWGSEGEDLGLPDTWLGDVPNRGAATTFTPPAGTDPYGLAAIHLRPGSELHGDYVPAPTADDSPYYYASLYLKNADGSLDYVDSTYMDEETHAFSFRAVARGYDYTVGVYDYEGDVETFLGDGTSGETATTVPVGPTDTSVDVGTIHAGVAQSRIRGSVVDQEGDGVSYSDVVVWQLQDDGTWQDVRYRSSNDNGDYSFRLPWGHTYTIEADAYDGAGVFLGDGTDIDAADRFTSSEAQPVVTLDPITVPRTGGDKVRGQVLDAAGDPVANAEVSLYSDYCPDEGGCWWQDDYAGTNATGHYVFRNVERGHSYVVSAQKYSAGFDEIFVGQVSRAADATIYTVPEDGGAVDVATITLDVSELTGTVLDDAGDPVADAEVILWSADDFCFEGCWGSWDYTTTDADGHYTFGRVDLGRTYTVSAEKPEKGLQRTFVGQVDNAESGTTYTQPDTGGVTAVDDITLTGSGLAGRVLDDANQPLAKASVTLWYDYCGDGSCWYQYDSTTTDAAGDYLFPYVGSGGPYTVSASKPKAGLGETFAGQVADVESASAYTVVDGAQTTVDDIALSPGTDIVRGTLSTSDGQPIDGDGYVTLYRLVDDGDGGYYLSYVDQTDTDDASYGFAKVEPGSYTLLGSYYPNDGPTYVRSWRGNARPTGPDSPGVFTVDGSGGVLSGIDLVIQRGTTLSGTVTTPAGAPVADAVVYVSEWVTDSGYDYTSNLDSTSTDENGHYTLTVPQNTDLFLEGYASGYQPFYLGDAGNPSTRTPENTLHSGLDALVHDFTMRPAPVAVEDPVISGTPEPGQTLTVSDGTWEIDGQPAQGLTFSYEWHNVSGAADGSTYVVQPADAGRRIRALVIAHLDGFDDQYAFSARVKVPAGPPVATNDTPPSLSPSDPAVGDTVTAEPGTWTPVEGTQDDLTFVYKWYRGAHRIHGASGSTYEAQPGDELKQIFVRVVAKRLGYANVSADSAPVTVANKPLVDQTTAPVLTGLPKVGETLSLDPGEWDAGGEPVTLTYRWASGYQTRNADPGSDELSYTQVASDRDKYLTAFVTATAPGHRKAVWTSTVGPVVAADVALGNLTVTVLDDASGDPLAGATVWGCDTSDWSCFASGVTDDAGHFTVQVRNGATYYLAVDGGDGTHHGAQLYLDTPATGDTSQEVRLTQPTPPPPNVTFPTQNGTYDGLPTVYFGDPQAFEVTGCAGVVSPSYTVTFSDGSAPVTGAMTPNGSTGIVTYSATIPAFYPAHGDATVSTNIPADCAGGTPPTTVHIYIDPSGVVTDQYGQPIEGATVTLSRSNFIGGPYADVPDGSDIMSPDNRSNPDTTDAIGFFQWDVSDGWYKVRVAATGCTTVTTPAMQVPPIQVDLLIKLDCTAPAPSPTPTITGTPKVGNTLSTTTTGWASVYTVTNQWKRDGAPIDGATGASYDLTPADAGKSITVTQTADRPDFVQAVGRGGPVDFTSASATSSPTTVAQGDAPTAAAPTLHGTAKTGQQLSVDAPVWNAGGVTSSYQWLRDGSPIAGATTAAYTLVAGDVGHEVSARVTGARTGYADGSVTSAAVTGALGDAAAATTAPAVTGAAAFGKTLTTTDGTWPAGVTLTRQWLRDGTAISGATGSTYAVTIADVGHALSVLVTATQAGYTDATSTSNALTVSKVASTTVGKLSAATVKAGKKVVYTITVKATGVSGPTGKITVYDGKKLVKTLTLAANAKGVVKFTLTKLKKGTHKLSAKYLGSSILGVSASKVSTLKVK